MQVVNLTPHKINLYDESKNLVATVAPSGTVARCSVDRKPLTPFAKFPLYKSEFGAVENMPEPEHDTIYIVSSLVLSALADTRPDVFCPGEAIRDEGGRVIGCVGLSR